MASNIIGSSFILAETAIAPNKTNNICLANNRVPSQSEQAEKGATVTGSSALAGTSTANETNKEYEYRLEIVWLNVILFIILHISTLYGFYLIFAYKAYLDYLYAHTIAVFGGFGITVGAHRLWSHRSYKAKWPMRVLLMLFQTLAFQNCIYEWVRDHRVHHKFTDTNADPHNSRRGFFFAHMGWLMCKKHNDVKEKGKQIDMSDLNADPIVMFQKRYYGIIMPLICFILPVLFPYYVLGSPLKVCFFVCSVVRYVLSLHFTWLVNSAAHFYGMKPYDTTISSSNNALVSMLANGEGWHNYHHVFPWDYKAAELGTYNKNFSTAFIDLFAKLGLAYDLKSASDEMIRKRIARTGDGSHSSLSSQAKEINNNNFSNPRERVVLLNHENEENPVWGWDDKDMREDDRRDACIVDKKKD